MVIETICMGLSALCIGFLAVLLAFIIGIILIYAIGMICMAVCMKYFPKITIKFKEKD